MRLIGFITEPATVRQILEYVGEPTSAPSIASARSTRNGIHRWLAVAQNAGISLVCIGTISRFFGLFGIRRPMPSEAPVSAGDYDYDLHVGNSEAPSLLDQYLGHPSPKAGGAPKKTSPEKDIL